MVIFEQLENKKKINLKYNFKQPMKQSMLKILKELKNSKYIYIKRNILGLIKSKLFKFQEIKI